MDGIYLTEDELWALSRCSGVAVKGYLRIRARMDIRTGVVGVRSGISYKMVQEWAAQAIEKGDGEAEQMPTYKQARVAVAQLERRGLLDRVRQPPGSKLLVFRCPLARLAEVRPKRTGHEQGSIKQSEQGTEQGTETGTNRAAPEASSGAGFDGFDEAEQGTEPDTEQGTNRAARKGPNRADIGDGVNPSTQQAACTPVNGVHAPARGRAAVASLARMESDPVPDELSRRATELAVALRKDGLQGINSANPRLRSWAEAGATPAQVVEALAVARARRGATGSHQPIGAGYLDPIVRDILNPPKARTTDAWWVSVPAMDAKARALGIATARAGESEQDYKSRIRAALLQHEAREA